MAYHRLYVHLVWTTRDRRPTIDRTAAALLAEQLPIIAKQERARILELGIVSTHVHLALRLHPATAMPRLVQRVKGTTSFSLRATHRRGHKLLWAPGYSITSVSERAVADVCRYVAAQFDRHPREAIPGWMPASLK
ncbi:MAG: IS200/IS605 family transposase [Gemmatimonadales bacterium]